MSFKSTVKSAISPQSLKRVACFIWDIFVIRASIGCLFLTLFLAANGGLSKATEHIVRSMANKALLGPAPEGMINISRCINDNPRENEQGASKPECQQSIVAIPIEYSVKATMEGTVVHVLVLYYLCGGLLGCLLDITYILVTTSVKKIPYYLGKKKHSKTKQKHVQFEKDVNWCMAKIEQHFSGQPYWEEWNIAAFSRQGKGDALYWADVNQEATKRTTAIPTTLHYQEAYREKNRIALFSLNVIASALLYTDEGRQHSDTLEAIIDLTHQPLSRRAPSSISEHDEALRCIQTCLNHFCHLLNAPQSDFVYYSNTMNKLRIDNINR